MLCEFLGERGDLGGAAELQVVETESLEAREVEQACEEVDGREGPVARVLVRDADLPDDWRRFELGEGSHVRISKGTSAHQERLQIGSLEVSH